jgi:predicted peroxiredoxin
VRDDAPVTDATLDATAAEVTPPIPFVQDVDAVELWLLADDRGSLAQRVSLDAGRTCRAGAPSSTVSPFVPRERSPVMAGKLLVNLATGMEDPERVTVALLVATAALDQGTTVVIWATKDAVRLALPGEAKGEACAGCPPLERLFQQFTDGGGELWLCPICLNSRGLGEAETVGNVKVAGATPMLEWAGDDTTVFSY